MHNKYIYYVLILLILAGCQSFDGNQRYPNLESPRPASITFDTTSEPANESALGGSTTVQPQQLVGLAAVKKQLPHITKNPLIAVLLVKNPEVSLTLPRGGVVDVDNGQSINIPSGVLRAKVTTSGITTNLTGRQSFGNRLAIKIRSISGEATFYANAYPPIGDPQSLIFSGQPEIVIDTASQQAMLIERVSLEDYLRGVLPTEISPSWPLEAIKAQAVVARSYTIDHYLVRLTKPWQLHWHFTVDMAYGGLKPLNKRMKVALDQTRGQILTAYGLPVPTFFHACSGGRTESAINFLPALLGADGVTKIASVMPAVNDPYAVPGATALGMINKYINWQVQLPLAEISSKLQQWARLHPEDNIPVGAIVKSVQIQNRFPDSGRVANLVIKYRIGTDILHFSMSAITFRLAVGPDKIRSTNWQHFTTKSKSTTLIIAGHGFGHGVGLSQVSAYQMAIEGKTASDIVRYFYPGAKLVEWW